MLSLGTRLSNYRQSRTHVSDMPPLVAALAWLREERDARERFIASGRSDGIAEEDMLYARAARIRALRRARDDRGSRQLERAISEHEEAA